MTMPENRQLSVTCKQDVGQDVVIRGEKLSPIAMRMYECLPSEINIKAVDSVAKIDQDIRTAAQSVRYSLEPNVSRFASVYGERALSALVLSHLMMVEDMANVSRPLKPEAMAAIAKTVTRVMLDDDVSLNLADIQIVADRLVKGEAGDIYGGLNSQIVVTAFTDYIKEKAEEIVCYRQEKAHEKYGKGFVGIERSCTTAKADERVKHVAAREAYNSGVLSQQIEERGSNKK